MLDAKLTISIPLDQAGSLLKSEGKNIGNTSKALGQGTSAIVDMLADALIKALLQKKGDGATFNNAGNNPLMDMIAKFMDQNAGKYRGPHDATGSVRNWQDEMSEDNYLNKQELSDFTAGLKDALNSVLGGGLQQVLGGVGNAMRGIGSAVGTMGGVAGGMAGAAMGGPAGSMLGSTLGNALGNSVGGAITGLGNSINGVANSFGGAGSNSSSGLGNAGFGSSGFGGAGFGSSSAGNIGMGSAPGLGNMSPMGQTGFSMGGDFSTHLGKTAVDGIRIKEDGGRFSFGKEDKDLAKDIGKFMDQHTDMFGVQPRGGWANRIEKGKDFNQQEIGRFKHAMDAVKGIMDGKSTGSQQVDMDAVMLSNAIINEGMHKVAA